MTENLTDASQFDDPVAVPVGSDLRNALSVKNVAQYLANRTKYLRDAQTPITLAALKAIGSPPNGMVRTVSARGVYTFDLSSSATPNDITVVQPTVGSGRWHLLSAVADVAYGFPQLDANGLVPLARQVRGGYVPSVVRGTLAADFAMSLSNPWTNAHTVTFTPVVGDIVVLSCNARFKSGNVAGAVELRMKVTASGTVWPPATPATDPSYDATNSTGYVRYSNTISFVAAEATLHTMALQLQTLPFAGWVEAGALLTALVIRP